MILRKLADNFSIRAYEVIGPSNYVRMMKSFLTNFCSIATTGNLNPLDEAMGRIPQPTKIKYNNFDFFIDCHYCDSKLMENSFTFGLIRELYIRNVYFAFHNQDTFRNLRTAIDLGANRGVFSVLMASHASKVISVECQPQYIETIEHNMLINGFRNYAVECAFVGGPGYYSAPIAAVMTIPEILEKHGLSFVDFIKIDIEGSEFALFESDAWLDLVQHISMELHVDCGNVQTIIDSLEKHNFAYIVADRNLQPIVNGGHPEFLYASRAPLERMSRPERG